MAGRDASTLVGAPILIRQIRTPARFQDRQIPRLHAHVPIPSQSGFPAR